MHSATEGLLDIVDELEAVFGTECSAVSSLRALVYYHMRGTSCGATRIDVRLCELS